MLSSTVFRYGVMSAIEGQNAEALPCLLRIPMKVFLSWSGVRSRMAAESFRDWLPYLINEVEPWMSSEDIKKGSRWATDLADRLANTEFALIFVTPENQSAPWMLFEAGALSSSLGGSVATVLIDIETEDLSGSPLGQFQDTKVRHDDVFRLVKTIAERVKWRLSEAHLTNLFDMMWAKIEEQLGQAWLAKIEEGGTAHPDSPQDLIGGRYRLRFSQWLDEFARAMKTPPRTVKAEFRVAEAVLTEARRVLERSCPAHPRFLGLSYEAPVDGVVAIEARACCRFALLVAYDNLRHLVK